MFPPLLSQWDSRHSPGSLDSAVIGIKVVVIKRAKRCVCNAGFNMIF